MCQVVNGATRKTQGEELENERSAVSDKWLRETSL